MRPSTVLARRLGQALRGEVRFDAGTRACYATDSSNYRHPPLGVVFPADDADVVAAMEVCDEAGVAVLARGAGTSLAGQACNEAVVLDTSRHLDEILEVDPERGVARVQPGVVLDRLREAAASHGLTFGPDPATHAWCTLGGMVGNNSCGTHGLTFGRTSDNVERLRAVTASGARLDLGAYDEAEARRQVARGGEQGRIVAALGELISRHADTVRAGFPRLERRVSGYNLDDLLPERGFHLARALVGTESTCAVVTEITARLVPLVPHRRVVVLGYRDIFAAADAVTDLRRAPLAALEGFDDVLVEHMIAARLHLDELALLPEGRGFLLAEVAGETSADAEGRAKQVLNAARGATEARLVTHAAEQAALWRIRESGLGATARPPGRPPNLEGWEDAAVPPERLGDYLRGIAELWARHGYSGAWYGHFGQGCVHTRNNFDLASAAGLAHYRAYVEDAAGLCVGLGGSLSGEHGDGQARGELLEKMFGAELVAAFGAFKAVFDPKGRMNPGRVVHARPLDADLRHGPHYRHVELGPTRMALRADGGSLQEAAERCVGVGRCLNRSTGVMCPSYRATGDERHSTRGRAKLLAELHQGELLDASWRNEEVFEALSWCLSCKGCQSDCPTHVDMATYKAEFLSHYYERRLRPAADYVLGLLPFLLIPATKAPRLANAFAGDHRLGKAVRKAVGLTLARSTPRLAERPFRTTPVARTRASTEGATVVVFPDTFSNAFLPARAQATVEVLEATGERVAVPRAFACCGRPLFDVGMLDIARASFRRLVGVLDPWTSKGVPVVVPEPSCLAALRDELLQLLPDDPRATRLAGLARSLPEHLAAHLETGRLDLDGVGRAGGSSPAPGPAGPARRSGEPGPAGSVAIYPHCHERATGAPRAGQQVLEAAGYAVELLDAGCCGLAGGFGFRAETDPLSRKVAATGFKPALEALAPSTSLVLDGFSCAIQASQLGIAESRSLAELLAERLGTDRRPS